MIERWRSLSRASKTLVVLGAILLLLAATGSLRADQGLEVTSEDAIEIAEQYLDFDAQRVQVRLLRQGFALRPVWAVSMSIPVPGTNTFERLTIVEIDAVTGDVLRIIHDS